MMIDELRKELKEVGENKILEEVTSFKVGGVADFYYIAQTLDDLVKAINLARKLKLPFFVMGRGTNIVVSDFGFPGLWIENRSSNLVFLEDKSQMVVDSGVILQRAIMEAASHDLSGLESLYGIPGTLGGAVYGNAGSRGAEIGSFVKYATLLTKEGKIVRYPQEWFGFDYRSSRLKREQERFAKEDGTIILSICLQLLRNKKEDIMERMGGAIKWRQAHQPLGARSAGSIFKNPAGQMSPEDQRKAAGFLLESVGAKKMKVGGAVVCSRHANFIINKNGKATASDIRQLIDQLRDKVKKQDDITLEEEVEYVGRWR